MGEAGIPLTVRVAGRRVVCVGGGRVARDKALPLVEAGADLVLVAPEAVPELAAAVEQRCFTWNIRAWEPADLNGAFLVLAATGDPAVNAAVVAAADARATWCVRVDADGDGSADLAAAVRRGPLTIAVSTGGQAPTLARRIRAELEHRYGPEWGELVALYGELRADPEVRAALSLLNDDERRARWRALEADHILRLILTGDRATAIKDAAACLSSPSG